MTFSRGGMYNAIGAALVMIFFQLREFKTTAKRLIPIAGLVLFFFLLVFPLMDTFTGGKLTERFTDTGTTRRGDIVESDFAIMAENPILGVGVGESKIYREKFLHYEANSHTEFSRLVSDHGSFGFLAVFCLFVIAVFNITRHESSFGKAFAGSMVAWSVLFMMNAGMRLAAPAFIWGLSYAAVRGYKTVRKRAAVTRAPDASPLAMPSGPTDHAATT
jgi:O-antigen ligase